MPVEAVTATLKVPATVPAVSAFAAIVATPWALVVAVVVLVDPNKPVATPGPAVGAVKVSVALGTTLLPASFTVTTIGVVYGAPTTALCGDPLVIVMEAGAPAVFVIEKVFVGALPAATVTR